MNRGKEKQTCSYCKKSYSNLMRHVKSVHKNHEFFSCDCCNKRFSSKSTLKRHLENIIYHCKKCFKRFSCANNRKKHERNCEESDSEKDVKKTLEKVLCETCGKLVDKRYYFNHLRSIEHLQFLTKRIDDKVEIVESCFNNTCTVFKIKVFNDGQKLDGKKFLNECAPIFNYLIESEIIKRKCLKCFISILDTS